MKSGAKQFAAKAAFAAVLASGLVSSFPTLALAEEKEGIALILPNLVEFVPMLVAFIIVLIVLGKFGWPMIDGIIVRREDTIKEALKKSEEAKVESERVLEEYKQQLAEAKAQSAQIIADAKQAGENAKAEITAKAQAEATNMIEKAHVAIEAEKKAAVAELQNSVADMSISVASRLVGNDLSDDEHRKIIEHYVSEAGSFNAN